MKIRVGLLPDEGKQNNPNLKHFPVVVEPETDKSVDGLITWLKNNYDWYEEQRKKVGAVLFRGFDVNDAEDFERITMLLSDGKLETGYLGTSPRVRVTKSGRVFTASEFPCRFPIPQHIEMSFLPESRPNKIFFYCFKPVSTPNTGETPICDFRRVYEEMDPKIRAEFEKKKMTNIRSYYSHQSTLKWDPFKSKPWEDIFATSDKKVIEQMCKKDEVEVLWKKNNECTLLNTQDPFLKHNETGTMAWGNHSNVFHLSSMPDDYHRAAQRQNSWILYLLCWLAWLIVFFKKLFVSRNDQAMHCVFGNGEEISDAKMKHVRDLIWKNMIFFQWRKGDVMCLDNRSVSHGRMPYEGPRAIYTCFSK